MQYHTNGAKEVPKEDADDGLPCCQTGGDERAPYIPGPGIDTVGAPEGSVRVPAPSPVLWRTDREIFILPWVPLGSRVIAVRFSFDRFDESLLT